MVKKKGSREMNPMDSHRKAERARQLARNKKERQLQREAMSLVDDPGTLRQQLKEILEEEELGTLNATQRSRKKTLQRAYDAAIRRQMESEATQKKKKKMQEQSVEDAPLAHIPLPPGMPPLPPGGMPPGGMPPGGMHLPPPSRPPPPAKIHQGGGGPAVSQSPVIVAKSTVVPLPKAHHDKKLTSLVPASVQASRPVASHQKKSLPGLVPRTVVKRTHTVATGGKSQPPTHASQDVPDNFDDFMNSLRSM